MQRESSPRQPSDSNSPRISAIGAKVWSWLASVLGFVALVLPATGELTANWPEQGTEAPLRGAADLHHRQWLATREGGGAIRLHRYRAEGPTMATLLYLPGTFMHGRISLSEEEHNPWIFLARRGVDVFTLDYRTSFLARDQAADPAMLEHWTVTRFLEDARHAAWKVRQVSGREKIIVAGFSRGVSFAYGLALAEPDGIAGLVALDGYFKHHAPRNSDDFDGRRAALKDAGDWIHDVGGSRGWEARQALMSAAATDPGAPALGDSAATVGQQLAEILFFAFGPGALANTRAQVSRIDVLARLMADYDRFYPKVQSLESEAMAAWADYPRSSLDDPLGEVRLPVIFFGSTGMGSDFLLHGIHSASLLSGGSPEIHVLEGWGHLDILVGEQARERVFAPLRAWIEATAGEPDE